MIRPFLLRLRCCRSLSPPALLECSCWAWVESRRSSLRTKRTSSRGSDWKKESSKSVKQQYQQIYNDAKDDLQKYREMTTGLKADGTAMKKYEFCHQFTFDVAVQLYGVMQYLFDSSLWRGTGGIVFQFSLGGSFTMTAVVGPVPVFAGVGATASAKIAGQLGMISKSPSLIEDWNFDYTQTPAFRHDHHRARDFCRRRVLRPGVCRTAGVGLSFVLPGYRGGARGSPAAAPCGRRWRSGRRCRAARHLQVVWEALGH